MNWRGGAGWGQDAQRKRESDGSVRDAGEAGGHNVRVPAPSMQLQGTLGTNLEEIEAEEHNFFAFLDSIGERVSKEDPVVREGEISATRQEDEYWVLCARTRAGVRVRVRV
jgi:hypothetical protein